MGSPALGCSVHIINQEGSEVEVRTAMRDTNEQGLTLTVEVTVDKLETAIYTVRVYDIESNGEASTDGAAAHTQMVDIAQPTTPPPTTTDSSGTPGTHIQHHVHTHTQVQVLCTPFLVGLHSLLIPSPDVGVTVALSPSDDNKSSTIPIIAGGIDSLLFNCAVSHCIPCVGRFYSGRSATNCRGCNNCVFSDCLCCKRQTEKI